MTRVKVLKQWARSKRAVHAVMHKHTFGAIGARVGVSRERVRQIVLEETGDRGLNLVLGRRRKVG